MLDKEGESRSYREGEKYGRWGYALYDRGYIRRYPMWPPTNVYGNDQASPVGSFKSTSLEGWEAGFKKIKELFNKQFVELKKDGVQVFHTEEERHAKRGTINGKRFGI